MKYIMSNRSNRSKYFIVLSCFLFLLFCGAGLVRVEASSTTPVKIDSITANYNGTSLLVGQEIDRTKIEVTAYYSDGTSKVIEDFGLSKTVVTIDGENQIVVVYGGKTATISVRGKKLESISAACERTTIMIGNGVDGNDVKVTAFYSDGTSEEVVDYVFSNNIARVVGSQTVKVNYSGKTAEFTIYGIKAPKLLSIHANYTGKGAVEGSRINRLDIQVVAVYEDSSTERITTYSLSPEVIVREGSNSVTVGYGGKTTTVSVLGMKKTVTELKAVYRGSAVVIGRNIQFKDIEATATFNDGSKSVVTDFTVSHPRVINVGKNTITIEYKGAKADIIVEGVEASDASFDNAAVFQIKNGSNVGSVAVALSGNVTKESVIGKTLKASKIKRVYRKLYKVTPKGANYIAFTITFTDDEIEDEMPMTIRVTLPTSYVIKDTKVFYTSNRKTIAAELTAEQIGTNILECKIHHPGTYFLSYAPEE